MGAMSIWHWAIVALVVVVLFGSKKLPESARGLGRSLRIFKSEMKEMQNEDAQVPKPVTPAQLPVADTATTPVANPSTVAHPTEPKPL